MSDQAGATGTLLVVGVALAIGWWLLSPKATAPTAPSRDSTPAASPPAKPVQPSTPGISEIGVLRALGDGSRVLLFAEQSDFDESVKLAAAKDETGWTMLVRSRAMSVPTGTRARHIETKFLGGIRVRVVDGPFDGQDGWVHREQLRPE